MKNILKFFDLNGGKIDLFYKDKRSIQSSFGGIMNLLLGIIFFLLIFSFGNDFFYRLNPSFLVQELSQVNYTKYNFTNQNFPFSFRFEDIYGDPVDVEENYLYFEIYYDKLERNSEGKLDLISSEILNYTQCNLDDFVNKDLFKSKGFEYFKCLDYSTIKYLSYGGDWDGDFVHYMYIYYKKCLEDDVNSKGVKCGKTETLNQILEDQTFISIYLPDVKVNPSNYEHPLNFDVKNTYFQIDRNLIKESYFRLNEIQLESNIGWILDNKYFESCISLNSYTIDYALASSKVNNDSYRSILGIMNFNMNKNIIKYVRSFAKIQSLAANIGGILKIFTFLITLIVQSYNKTQFRI